MTLVWSIFYLNGLPKCSVCWAIFLANTPSLLYSLISQKWCYSIATPRWPHQLSFLLPFFIANLDGISHVAYMIEHKNLPFPHYGCDPFPCFPKTIWWPRFLKPTASVKYNLIYLTIEFTYALAYLNAISCLIWLLLLWCLSLLTRDF